MKKNEETIIIFAFGANDSQFLQRENKRRISIEKFRENVQKLTRIAKRFSSKIVFLGLIPVDERKTIPISWDSNKFYKNEYIRKYNEVIKETCKENGVYFIELFERFEKVNYQELLEDGLHPNSRGHQKIFEIVKEFLIEKKFI